MANLKIWVDSTELEYLKFCRDKLRVGVSEALASDRIYTPNPYIMAEEDKENKEQMAKKRSKISPLKQAQSEPAQKKGADSEEDDELGIPAFIRKKMM